MSGKLQAVALGLAPAAFVLLWSTGFIGAKLGLPHVEPLTFLSIRFACVASLLALLALALRRPWPADRRTCAHLGVTGVMLHGGYLSGVFGAIHGGLSAGQVALIVGLQPLLTALLSAVFLGERVSRPQWLGLLLGFVGVVLVLGQRVGTGGSHAALGLALMALVGITLGTLYQKRYVPSFDLWTGSALQFAAALLVVAPMSWAFESGRIDWTPDFVFALAWLTLVLSIGAISLLHLLIRRGAATRVSALFYLTPPSTALLAWLVFDERLTVGAFAGMVLCGFGVWLVIGRR
jgi:drug/metabolite transporter (DMT)-like permease